MINLIKYTIFMSSKQDLLVNQVFLIFINNNDKIKLWNIYFIWIFKKLNPKKHMKWKDCWIWYGNHIILRKT